MTAKTKKLMSSPLSWIALGSAISAVIASFGVLLSATDPQILIASAEHEAASALSRGNYSWARVEIKDRVVFLKGEAPGEPERIMAFETVRKALQPALRDGYVIDGLRSQLTLAAAPPPKANFAKLAPQISEPAPDLDLVAATEHAPESDDTAAEAAMNTSEPALSAAASAAKPARGTTISTATTWTAADSPVPVMNSTAVTIAAVPATPANPATSGIETASVEKTPATDCRNEISSTLTQSKIVFASDSDVISAESSPTLDKLAQIATRCGAFKLTVEGHTDATGKNARNESLSERRAFAVRNALIRRGIARDRLRAVGLGARRPIAKGEDEAARAQNRRIEITLTEINSTKSTAQNAAKN